MRSPLKFVCLGIFLNTFLTRTTECITVLKDLSFAGPYTGVEPAMLENWHLVDSVIKPNYIQLTSETPMDHGAIWTTKPFLPSEWEFQVNFKIFGSKTNYFGNGIAIWYVKDPNQIGPVFGSKDNFSGLGVFIDTTVENPAFPHNHNHPYVSAMVNNGSASYFHDEDGTIMQLGGCNAYLRNEKVPTRIAVAYIKETVAVYLDFEGIGQWKTCFASLGVHLPTGYYFGISADTGTYVDNHHILSVTTLDMTEPEKPQEDRSGIVPWAENIQFPEKYKALLDQGIAAAADDKALKEQPVPQPMPQPVQPPKVEEPKIEVKKPDRFIIPQEIPKEEIKEERIEETEETEEIEEEPPAVDVVKMVETEKVEEWSWTLKLLFLLIIIVLVFYVIKCCKNYRAQRKVMRDKRLY